MTATWRALPRSLPLLLALVAAASSAYTFLGECACATCAESRCDIVEGEVHALGDYMSALECARRCDALGSTCVAYQTHTRAAETGYCGVFRTDLGNPTPTHVWGAGISAACTGW